jgi:predicted RND superfamily exporter protein
VAEKAAPAGNAWSFVERCLRTLQTNHGFTISVFAAVAITAMFAFVFEAPQEPVAALLVLGVLTAIAGYIFRSRSGHRP